MTKITIEKETTHDGLTDEQWVVIDGIRQIVDKLQEMIDIFEEATDYNEPRLRGHVPSLPEGYRYTITADTSNLHRLQKQVDGLWNAWNKAVSY